MRDLELRCELGGMKHCYAKNEKNRVDETFDQMVCQTHPFVTLFGKESLRSFD